MANLHVLVVYRYCWVDSDHLCLKAASEGEIFDPILKCGEGIVMMKRTENKYKISLSILLEAWAVKKGPCQRLTCRNRKSQKPRDLWPFREHSLPLISWSLFCACCLFLPPLSVHFASSLLLRSCILHMLPPTQCALLTLYLLLCCLQAKATCKVELLLHLLQSCCLCCVWTFPLCCLTCLDLFF